MTTYTGTGAQVFMSAEGFNDEPLEPEDVNDVTVTIYDTDKITKLVNEATMQWSEDELGWIYLWDPDDQPPGSYEAEVTINFPSGPPAVGFTRVRLKKRRAPLTP